jgi:tetratricopeptide (TPR) repeat protein
LADSLGKAGDSTAAMAAVEKAVTHMERSVELCWGFKDKGVDGWNKMHCNRLNLLALSQMKAQKNEEAIVSLAKLAEMNPEDQLAYFQMARIYYGQKKWTKAIDLYNKALPVIPDNYKPTVYSRIARAYDKQLKNYPKAIEAYTKLIPIAPPKNKNGAILSRAIARYSLANQLDYAEDQNVDMDQLIQDGKITIARADRALGLYDKAEADFQKVTGRYAKSAKEHLANIAQLRDRLTKIKKQIDYYERTK